MATAPDVFALWELLTGRRAPRPPRRASPGRARRPPRPPDKVEREYVRALGRFTEAVIGETRAVLDPYLEARTDAARLDRGEDETRSLLARLLERLQGLAEATAQAVLARIAGQLDAHVRRELERILGISLAPPPPPALAASTADWRRANVALIRSIPEQLHGDLVRLLQEGAGMRVETLRKRIEERFDITRRRAALIAEDQVLTLAAQMNEQRQQEAGVVEYIWSTSRDERVRDSHAALDGTRHRWDQPPLVDGKRAHPGEPIRCRCVAIAVL